jgi:RNA polymerase sigma factor (sigma-70 family)
MDDHELLRDYVERQSETAFAELVSRHLNLVYATALRLVGDSQAAQDVAQTVFILLARQAWKVRDGKALPAWLYRAACRTALNDIRHEQRRRQRETEAMNRAELAADTEATLARITPMLDAAMQRLNPVEQNAIILRFFENKSLRETGNALKMNEQAAHKRITRAVEKLRAHFARGGITTTSAVLAATLGMSSTQAAPIGLAASITGASLASAGGSIGVAGTILKFFYLMNTKTQIAAAAILLSLLAVPFLRSANFTNNKVLAATTVAAADRPSQTAVSVAPAITSQGPTATSQTQEQTGISPIASESISTQSNASSASPPLIAAISGNTGQAKPVPGAMRFLDGTTAVSAGQAAPVTPDPTTLAHLDATQKVLAQALTALQAAAANRFGEYKDKAIADVTQGQEDVTHAMDYLKAAPEIEFAPSPAPTATSPARPADILGSGRNDVPTNKYGQMYKAMNSLILAHDYWAGNSADGFQAGNMGGLRDGILADIDNAAADILAGVKFADAAAAANPSAAAAPKPAMPPPPSRNMTVRLQGTLADSHDVDVTFVCNGGFGGDLDGGPTQRDGHSFEHIFQVQGSISMVGDNFQVLCRIFDLAGDGGMTSTATLKPGESNTATSPNGKSKITLTLTEAAN